MMVELETSQVEFDCASKTPLNIGAHLSVEGSLDAVSETMQMAALRCGEVMMVTEDQMAVSCADQRTLNCTTNR